VPPAAPTLLESLAPRRRAVRELAREIRNATRRTDTAFQANNGDLYVDFTNQNLLMDHGTSPSIVPLPVGGYQVAYEGSNDDLWLDVNGTGVDTNLGMHP
jgi:hypothetical protein